MPFPIDSIREVKCGQGKVSFTIQSNELVQIIQVDSLSRLIEEIRLVDSLGIEKGNLTFRNFERFTIEQTKIVLPSIIKIISYQEKNGERVLREVELKYFERRFNPSDFKIDFKPPKNAQLAPIELMRVP